MKRILGLDLGTNSIGWALVDKENKKIMGIGSRIIAMGSDKIDYEKGAGITKNADRRMARSIRKMNKRYKLRRNKLLFVLHELGLLPEQFQFKNGIPEPTKLQEMELLPIRKGTLQLDSLSHYKLRVNASTKEVGLKELGKILYHFNQLRGYAGGGDEDEKTIGKSINDGDEEIKKGYEVKVEKVEIVRVEKSDRTFKAKDGEQNFFDLTILYEGDEIEGETKLQNLNIGEEELEIRIKTNKKGDVSYQFALPRKTNWRKQMEANRDRLKAGKMHISQLLFEDLKNEGKWTKIRNRVFLRNDYKAEFDAIWDEQARHHSILSNCPNEKIEKIANYIFPGKSESQQNLREQAINGGLKHILKEQIIYYQRPLKSQSHLIGTCQFEKDQQVAPISHPFFQEFRSWDQINRMYITTKAQYFDERKKRETYKYTNRYLAREQKQEIFKRLQNQKQLGFNEVAKIIGLKSDKTEYLNGLNVKAKLKGCDTSISIKNLLGEKYPLLFEKDNEIVTKLWSVLHNQTGNEYDENSPIVRKLIELLSQYLNKDDATDLALTLAQKLKFNRKYASLSLMAIRKILPLMQPNSLIAHNAVMEKIEKIRNTIETGEISESDGIETYMIEYIHDNPDVIESGGLMYVFAASLIYGRHSSNDIKRDITDYHQIIYNPDRKLRNPVVEQITNETMQVIKSLWKQHKLNPDELEIRVELARDLKNSAQEREKIYKGQIKSRQINDTIKKRLIELKQEPTQRNIDLFKLWSNQRTEDYPKQSKEPTKQEIEKLRIWEEQKCISPYTLKPIPLSSLFSTERLYDIDHIIPKSRYFDDSLSNKIVCETNINEEKSNRTAWEYISQQSSQYGICSIESYVSHVNNTFFGKKKKNLLLEKIPGNMVERQMKETQYISVAIKSELARIVGSNNVKTSTGEVTAFLRSKWGLRKLFMQLTEPRFRQMELWDIDPNTLQPRNSWVTKDFDQEQNKHIYEIKNWSKRYDHRHHAIDALVVALTEQSHIQRLNNLNKELQVWLKENKEKIGLDVSEGETELEAFFNLDERRRDEIQRRIESPLKFDRPFKDLDHQVKLHLESMLVSHKPKDKISTRMDLLDPNTPKKKLRKQLKIRSALHEATYYGKWNGLDTKTVDISNLSVKDISKILDKTLMEEIDTHRRKKEYSHMKEAFSGEGLKAFNESRFQRKNPDKLKPPVYKVKLRYHSNEDAKSSLQSLYDRNPKQTVVTGDNYLFIVMEKEGKKGKERVFGIASLYDSVDIAKRSLKEGNEDFKRRIAEDHLITHNDKPNRVLFTLQQNELVYMSENDDDAVLNFSTDEFSKWINNIDNKKSFTSRVYKVVKFTGKDCFFIPHNYANPISVPKDLTEVELEKLKVNYADKKIPKQELNYQEFGSFGTSAKTEVNASFVSELVLKKNFNGQSPRKIQDHCIKIKTDWLGNMRIVK